MIFNSPKNRAIENSQNLRFSNAVGTTSEAHQTPTQRARNCGFDLQLLGVEAHGTILSFGQIHKHPLREEERETKLVIVDAQQQILDDLLRIRPERVFVEGCYHSRSSEDILGEEVPPWRESVLKSFSDYRPGQRLTPDQENLLLNCLCPIIYLVLATEGSQSVSLLATTTEEDDRRHMAYLARVGGMDMSVMLMRGRETRALKMVQDSLNKHGGTVALIFGSGHQKNWPGACDFGFHPTIYSKDYSGISSQMLEKMRGDEEKAKQASSLPHGFNFNRTQAAAFKRLTNALAVRLCDCGALEREEILNAFQKMHLLPHLMLDPRVGRAVLIHKIFKISITRPMEKEDANAIVSDALSLPDVHCRAVLRELDLRRAFTTNEVERTSIDDALKGAKGYKRLPFSF